MSRLTDRIASVGFRTGDYTVTRRAAPTFVEGVAVLGSTSTFATGPASLQPLDGADLKVLPEGVHATDARKLYTTAALQLVPVPDTIAVVTPANEAGTWTAYHIDGPHNARGGAHSVVYLAKRGLP